MFFIVSAITFVEVANTTPAVIRPPNKLSFAASIHSMGASFERRSSVYTIKQTIATATEAITIIIYFENQFKFTGLERETPTRATPVP